MATRQILLALGGLVFLFGGLLILPSANLAQTNNASYAGSRECRDCHRDSYETHEMSIHDLAFFDSTDEDYASAIIADFSQENATLQEMNITQENIAFAVGAGNDAQQYVIQTEDGSYSLLPITWNVDSNSWQEGPYHTNIEITGDFSADCATCHTTGYDIETGGWEDDGVSCEACHGPGDDHVEVADDAGGSIDDDELVLIQEAIAVDIPTACTNCHLDLTVDFAQDFIANQQEDVSKRWQAIETFLDENPASITPELGDKAEIVMDDVSLGVHNVAKVRTLLSEMEQVLGLIELPEVVVSQMAPVTNPDDCAECHIEQHQNWLISPHANASLQEQFQRTYAENGQPGFCLRCHASGYDPATQSYAFDGVVCSNCHTIEGEHPPGPASVATDASTCATCHSGGHASVYEEWLVSDHSEAGVDCIDCHDAHSNSLILDDVNSTCGDCHATAMNDEVHMGQDMVCTDCHMTPRHDVNDPTMISITGHNMQIDPRVCADCHGNTHSLTLNSTGEAIAIDHTTDELNAEIARLEEEASDNLMTGLFGGALGAALLFAITYIAIRLGRLR